MTMIVTRYDTQIYSLIYEKEKKRLSVLQTIWFDLARDYIKYEDAGRRVRMMERNFMRDHLLIEEFGFAGGLEYMTDDDIQRVEEVALFHAELLIEFLRYWKEFFSANEPFPPSSISRLDHDNGHYRPELMADVVLCDFLSAKSLVWRSPRYAHIPLAQDNYPRLCRPDVNSFAVAMYLADRCSHWESRLEYGVNRKPFATEIEPYNAPPKNKRVAAMRNANGILIKETDVTVKKR